MSLIRRVSENQAAMERKWMNRLSGAARRLRRITRPDSRPITVRDESIYRLLVIPDSHLDRGADNHQSPSRLSPPASSPHAAASLPRSAGIYWISLGSFSK